MKKSPTLFTGITRKRWTGYLLIGAALILLLLLVYHQARRTVLHEIRRHAMGVAIAAAAGIEAESLQAIRSPEDMESEAYLRIQKLLNNILSANLDVRYLYTMRRSTREEAPASEYEYIVDASPRDLDQDDIISKEEASEPPGAPYDASNLPEMLRAWEEPSADRTISPDPPYPDLLSGYAPIRNEKRQTVGIVGVDITADTVRYKLLAFQGALLVVWIILTFLLISLLQLYYHQHDTLDHIQALSRELSERNHLLRSANVRLSEQNEQAHKDAQLAQTLQLRMIPKTFPCQDQIHFDHLYLACDAPGGDFFDSFMLDDRHLALYMADVSGRGVSTALVTSLLKNAFANVRDRHASASQRFRADLFDPGAVLSAFNDMLNHEIPEHDFATMIYAVLDLSTRTFSIARAGHPPPLLYARESASATAWDGPAGVALGLLDRQSYATARHIAQTGDKVLFFTDGLSGALNKEGDSFGEERVLEVFQQNGHKPTAEVIAALQKAVEDHRGGCAVNDDFSILLAEIKG